MALSDRRKAFCREYVVDRNATQAAIRAGYAPKSAGRNADRMMKNDEIREFISELEGALAKRADMDADWVMARLRAVAESPDVVVSSASQVKALELIGRHLGMWPKDDPPQPVEGIAERMTRLYREMKEDPDYEEPWERGQRLREEAAAKH